MMFDAFDVASLRFRVEAEQRKKTGERCVPVSNLAGDFAALVGQHQAAIFFVVEIAGLAPAFCTMLVTEACLTFNDDAMSTTRA